MREAGPQGACWPGRSLIPRECLNCRAGRSACHARARGAISTGPLHPTTHSPTHPLGLLCARASPSFPPSGSRTACPRGTARTSATTRWGVEPSAQRQLAGACSFTPLPLSGTCAGAAFAPFVCQLAQRGRVPGRNSAAWAMQSPTPHSCRHPRLVRPQGCPAWRLLWPGAQRLRVPGAAGRPQHAEHATPNRRDPQLRQVRPCPPARPPGSRLPGPLPSSPHQPRPLLDRTARTACRAGSGALTASAAQGASRLAASSSAALLCSAPVADRSRPPGGAEADPGAKGGGGGQQRDDGSSGEDDLDWDDDAPTYLDSCG